MTVEQRREVVDALVGFVLRASEKFATSEEVNALPEVAELLLGSKVTP